MSSRIINRVRGIRGSFARGSIITTPTQGTRGPAQLTDINSLASQLVTAGLSGTSGVGGTVTSVGMTVPGFLSVTPSTITTSGTFAISLANQADKTIFSNISGGSAAPSFNTLTAVFDHDLGSTNDQIVSRISGTWGARNLSDLLTAGSGITLSGTTNITISSTGSTTVSVQPNWPAPRMGNVRAELWGDAGEFSNDGAACTGPSCTGPAGGETIQWNTPRQYGGFKMFDGVRWIQRSNGVLINRRFITSTQTYVPTIGTNTIVATLVGGGGGGGGCAATAAGQSAISGGGGAGAVCIKKAAVGLASGLTITIGAAGTGGAAGANAGTAGGDSTFGTVLTAHGGQAGAAGALQVAPSAVGGNSNVSATGGDLNFAGVGAPGVTWTTNNWLTSSYGSDSAQGWGIGGSGASIGASGQAQGNAAIGFGGGGAGSVSGNGGTAVAGANGTAGICIIDEYA